MTDKWLESTESYVAIVIVHREVLTVCRCSDYLVPANGKWVSPSLNLINGLL